MPNWCSCSVTIDCSEALFNEICTYMRSEANVFDFDKIIPMPESLDIEAGSTTDEAIAYYVTERLIIPVDQTKLSELISNPDAGWGFGDHDFENEPFRETGEWYDHDNQKALECTTQMMILEAREKQLTASLNALKKPTGMKAGLIVFASFSFFNIIAPLILTLFSFSGKSAIVVAAISIMLLTIGLVVTFFYLAWMLKWKEKEFI